MKYSESNYKYQLEEDLFYQTNFRFDADIFIAGYIYLDKNGLLRIYRGYAWDGASGPTIDTKSSIRGSCIHDALYQLIREGLLDISLRESADIILEKVCIEDGMFSWRAAYWRFFVSKFAKSAAESKNRKIILVAP